MKLISLNVWNGKLREQLFQFLKREADSTDIFCFQEMVNVVGVSSETPDLFSDIAKLLPGFQGFFEAAQDESNGIADGLAMFVKKPIKLKKREIFCVSDEECHGRQRRANFGQKCPICEIFAIRQRIRCHEFSRLMDRRRQGRYRG